MKENALTVTEENNPPVATINDALLQIVMRKDIDPDRLEKFLDLQIKVETRQAEKDFAEAMASFQGSCPIIKKTKGVNFTSKSGSTTKYNYSPLDEIVHIIKPLLEQNGLSFSFDIQPSGDRGLCCLLTTIGHRGGHSKSFRYEFPDIHDDTRMNESQRRKSALTFAKRAGLENALGIVTTEEDDDARRAVDAPISKEQVEEIGRLMKLTDTNEKVFLKFCQCDSFSELSDYDAKKAITALKTKRAKCIK